jgi:multimeric flavodoxin WrbA
MKKLLILYYSKTGKTKKIAEEILEGAKKNPNIASKMVDVQNIQPEEVAVADGFAFGSPTYFSGMSAPVLSLLTDLFFIKDKVTGKPMASFSTGAGGQAKTIENIESVLKTFNPKLITGLAFGQEFSDSDLSDAQKLGEKLASAIM